MPLNLPDPAAAAKATADHLKADPAQFLHGPLQRLLNDSPWVDRASLLEGLETFHQERMAKVPSATQYPESKPWVEHKLALDRELKRQAGLSDQELALVQSLQDYVRWRGYRQAVKAPQTAGEKCRVLFMPTSDRGAVHIKNVDDPCTYWKPSPTLAKPSKRPERPKLTLDGVGSGLHIDDEPDEIFPLNAREMFTHYTEDVPGAVDFLTRYKLFWGGQNVVIEDDQNRSVAVEKCSHNFIEVFEPHKGRSHCSGMACRDPQSPQGQYQRQRRLEYLKRFDQPLDGPDMVFWDACDRAERMLADYVRNSGDVPKFDEMVELFTTPWPNGLNKAGVKLHPDAAVEEYTLVTHLTLYDEGTYMRWQRDESLAYPDKPEVVTWPA